MAAGKKADREPTPEENRTFLFWLSKHLRELRECKDVSIADIAVLVDGRKTGKPINTSSLSRFENGESWPDRPDQTVAAYAYLCGYEDARELWKEAIERFIKKGGAPAIEDLRSPGRALRLASEAAQRTRPYVAESPDKPTSIPRRRAAR